MQPMITHSSEKHCSVFGKPTPLFIITNSVNF